MGQVELPLEYAVRYVHEFYGGLKQRVGIARNLIMTLSISPGKEGDSIPTNPSTITNEI